MKLKPLNPAVHHSTRYNMKISACLFLCLFIAVQVLAQNSPSADYREQHRPQFHFSPPAKWMNDPNGLVYYEGEYHLFYQYYPEATVWGPMHWGHAVSKDLLRWENLPIALFPDKHGYIFSGSAVIDSKNTSGFKQGPNAPMVAMFTYHLMEGEKAGKSDFQTQGIAYSNDKGRTWTKYEGNPVIGNESGIRDFRDPKVFWHEASGQWVMILAAGDRAHIYNSPDLKSWTKASEFGPGQGAPGKPWECPDLFELTADGKSRWVMLVSLGNGAPNGGSGTEYFVGTFDGKTFKNDNLASTTLWVDHGTDNYAGVTWNNAPYGRRLFIGWMSNWAYAQKVPTDKWRSAMTLPRELSLFKSGNLTLLASKPVKEVEKLRKSRFVLDMKKPYHATSALQEVLLEIDLSKTTSTDIGIEISNKKGEKISVGFEVKAGQFYIDRTEAGKRTFSDVFAAKHTAKRVSGSNILKMRLLLDTSTAELFADDGSVVMSDIFFPNEDFKTLKLLQNTGSLKVIKAEGFELKGTW